MVVEVHVHGFPDNWMAVDWQTEGAGIQREHRMANGLVHVRVELVGCGGRRGTEREGVIRVDDGGGDGLVGKRWMEVAEGDDAVAIMDGVREGEEGVFSARYEGDSLWS